MRMVEFLQFVGFVLVVILAIVLYVEGTTTTLASP